MVRLSVLQSFSKSYTRTHTHTHTLWWLGSQSRDGGQTTHEAEDSVSAATGLQTCLALHADPDLATCCGDRTSGHSSLHLLFLLRGRRGGRTSEEIGLRPAQRQLSMPTPPTRQPHLLEAVVLLAVGTVPAVPVPIGHQRVLVAEPAVDHRMRWLHPVDQGQESRPW